MGKDCVKEEVEMLYPQADELKNFFFSFFCYIIDKTIKHLKCTM